MTGYFACDAAPPVERGRQGIAIDGKAQRGRLAYADAAEFAVRELAVYCHE